MYSDIQPVIYFLRGGVDTSSSNSAGAGRLRPTTTKKRYVNARDRRVDVVLTIVGDERQGRALG